MKAAHPSAGQKIIAQRWQTALSQAEPNLPSPIIEAMVQNVMRGSLGEPLRQLEQAILQLETTNVGDLTGSEARTILAILKNLHGQAEQLEGKIRQLWSVPS